MTSIGRSGWDRPGNRRGVTTFSERELGGGPASRTMSHGPAAWIGLALMVANTAIALLDLFLLSGGIPR